MKKDILTEAHITEQVMAREDYADSLVESYSAKEDIVGKRWVESYNKNPRAIRRTAMALKNFENSVRHMDEATISSNFQVPLQNLQQLIRLSYPNMIFPEIFTAHQMSHWNDAIYYIDTITGRTIRDGVQGTKTYETAYANYSRPVEMATIDGAGAGTNYTGTLGAGVIPLTPYKVTIMLENKPVATDNGTGTIVNAYGSSLLSTVTASTIDYATGDYDITFTVAPGQVINAEFSFDTEVEANFDQLAHVDIRVRDYQFRPQPQELGISWSHMAELKMKYTLNQDVDSILNSASIEVMRQNQDITNLRFGYGMACKQAKTIWDANFVASNTYTMKDHLDTFTYAVDRASADMYNTTKRGVINKMYGSSKVVAILRQHRNFVADTSMLKIGCFKAGTINGIDIFQVPDEVFLNPADANSDNDLVCVFKDEQEAGNHSIVFGEIVPITATPTLEYGNVNRGFTKDYGLYRYGDKLAIENRFLKVIRLQNIPTK